MQTYTLDQLPWERPFNKKFRLLAFLAVVPVTCLDGIPVNLVQLCEIATILKKWKDPALDNVKAHLKLFWSAQATVSRRSASIWTMGPCPPRYTNAGWFFM